MSIEITKVVDNALFARKDVNFVLRHPGLTTPTRQQMKDLVAAEIGAKASLVVIDNLESATGMAATRGLARAYATLEAAQATERPHFMKRNNIEMPGNKAASE
jgi:small subunit ribosomal protein S24e